MKTITKQIVTTKTVNVATLEDFTNFLEERKLLYKYLTNCSETATVIGLRDFRPNPFIKTNRPLEEFCEFLKNHIYRYTGTDEVNEGWYRFLIQASFVWNDTAEQMNCWCKASDEWKSWCTDNKIKDFEI